MKKSELELYLDYLLSTFGATTTTGLSAMVDGDVSHERITRFLSRQVTTGPELVARFWNVAQSGNSCSTNPMGR